MTESEIKIIACIDKCPCISYINRPFSKLAQTQKLLAEINNYIDKNILTPGMSIKKTANA